MMIIVILLIMILILITTLTTIITICFPVHDELLACRTILACGPALCIPVWFTDTTVLAIT